MAEDRELIKRVIEGEKEVFEMIIQKYQRPLLNYISRMVGQGELALDFTQEVFIKTYSSLHQYQPQYKFSTWLFKIASNFVIDFWRKKKIDAFSIDQQQKESYELYPQIPTNEPSVVKKYELSELKERIELALEKIPSSFRELFIWRHINGFSYEEMAEIKSLPIGTIKNKVFQAKELIRKQLEDTQ